MKLGPPGRLEGILARFLPSPRHGFILRPLRSDRRIGGMAMSAAMGAVSLAGRGMLRAAGRSAPLAPERIKRIAFIKIDHLGDIIQAQSLMSALKAWNPGARITVFAGSRSAELLLRFPWIDEVEPANVPWIKPDSNPLANLKACLSLAAHLRECSYDLAVDLRYHNRLDSLLLSLSGARFRLGFDVGGFGFWLTHRADWPVSGHESDRQAKALAQFGIPVANLPPVLEVKSAELEKAAAWLASCAAGRGPVVAIHVGAGNPVKRWMPERFAWVARELVRHAKSRIVLLAGRDEMEAGNPLAASVPPRSLLDCGDLRASAKWRRFRSSQAFS